MTIFMFALIFACVVCCSFMCISRAAQIIGILILTLGFVLSFASSMLFLIFIIPMMFWSCFWSKKYRENKEMENETNEQTYARLFHKTELLYNLNNPTIYIPQIKMMIKKELRNNRITQEQANSLMSIVICFEYKHISMTKAEVDELVSKEF